MEKTIRINSVLVKPTTSEAYLTLLINREGSAWKVAYYSLESGWLINELEGKVIGWAKLPDTASTTEDQLFINGLTEGLREAYLEDKGEK